MGNKKGDSKLSDKSKLFCESFAEHGDVALAMSDAGYVGDEKVLTQKGKALLLKPVVQQYLEEVKAVNASKQIADGDEIMSFLTAVMRGEIQDQFGLDASLADRIKASQELAKRQIDLVEKEKEANKGGGETVIKLVRE